MARILWRCDSAAHKTQFRDVRKKTACYLRLLEECRPFPIGPFVVTPFLIDHSAFDAHMLLIEVCGRRIIYSGDFKRMDGSRFSCVG